MNRYLSYIKIGLILLLAVFIGWDLRSESVSSAKLEDVEAAVVKAAGFQDAEPAANRMIRRFYGLNPRDFDGAVLYAPSDNMDVHEILIVKLADLSQSQTVQDAIEERLATQKKSFEGYGVEQTKLLNDHVLQVSGNYILYAVGEHAADARTAFLNSL